MLKQYHNWLLNDGKSENTIKRYMAIVKSFQEWYLNTGQKHFDPKLVSALDLHDWKSYLLNVAKTKTGQRYKVSTVNNCIKGIKSYFHFLMESGVIPTNPAEKLKPQKVQHDDVVRWLSRSERNRLLAYINDERLKEKNRWRFTRNRALIFLMLLAGLREGEVVAVELDDIDFDAGYVFVRDGKGGKARRIEMNTDLRKALHEWIEQRGKVETKKLFTSQKGVLTEQGVIHVCRTISKHTGLLLTPHTLRHTFGHDLAKRGFRIETIADLLGHSNINYTRIYTRSGKSERQAAVEALSGEKS